MKHRRSRYGVDCATWQGSPGEWRPETGRMGWAAIKLTELSSEGAYENPEAAADWRFLKEHGKGRVAYLFGHPGQPVEETVRLFVTAMARLGIEDDDAVAVDLEENSGLTPPLVAAWADRVLDALRRQYDRMPVLYTYRAFAWAGNCAGLGRWPLWISDPDSPAGHPQVPAPWKTWAIHQWSITSPLDRDIIAYPTVEEMGRVLGKAGREHKKKHHVRRMTWQVRDAAVAAASATRRTAAREPVLAAGSAAGLLSAALVFLQHHIGLHLTATELKAVVTALVAVAGAVSALRTRPVRVTVVAAALGAVATAAAAFGLHLPVQILGAEMPIAALLVALLVRVHVSPVNAAQEPDHSSAGPH